MGFSVIEMFASIQVRVVWADFAVLIRKYLHKCFDLYPVSFLSTDSIDSSGYGSLYSKFGSTSSTPSVMLASQYSNSEKGSKNDASEDKNRSRSVRLMLRCPILLTLLLVSCDFTKSEP